MGTKMKGLLKGLRYISQIFDPKEEEMKIGYPTDVKHVAHIGLDGPSVGSPSWMGEFRSTPPSPNGGAREDGDSQHRRADPQHLAGGPDSNARELPAVPLPRPARRNPSASADLPNHEPAAAPASGGSMRPSRRHHQSSSSVSGSQPQEASEGSRNGRRHRSTAGNIFGGVNDSSSQQQQEGAIPKNSRRRRPKGAAEAAGGDGGGSTRRSSRSKALPLSVSDPGPENETTEPLRSALQPKIDEDEAS